MTDEERAEMIADIERRSVRIDQLLRDRLGLRHLRVVGASRVVPPAEPERKPATVSPFRPRLIGGAA
jgi:hypothetical protein